MKLVFDLDNLNRTADYLVENNHILRRREDNPIRHMMNSLAAAVEAKVRELPLSKLLRDSEGEVHYLFEGGSGVVFFLVIKSPNGRLGNSNAKQHGEVEYDDERWSMRELTGLTSELDGYTIQPQFFTRPGADPHTIGL